MLLPVFGVQAPTQQETLNLITEKKPAIVKVVEPTLEEKIKKNYYKCKEEVEWIRADNGRCLAKQPQHTTKAQKPVRRAENASGNGYEPGQCVWYVKNKRPDLPNNWGNASSWLGNAQAQGWPTGSTPVVGSVGWTPTHVVFIEAVNSDGTVTYSDMNGRFVAWEVGSGTKPASYYQYIY